MMMLACATRFNGVQSLAEGWGLSGCHAAVHPTFSVQNVLQTQMGHFILQCKVNVCEYTQENISQCWILIFVTDLWFVID